MELFVSNEEKTELVLPPEKRKNFDSITVEAGWKLIINWNDKIFRTEAVIIKTHMYALVHSTGATKHANHFESILNSSNQLNFVYQKCSECLRFVYG